ncbi:MAG TPA: glycoside hydrolase family 44 protein, partial [Polyangia bacterium]|nr:glycoside hydrolase family 44 protein [Polyangia bacterium]
MKPLSILTIFLVAGVLVAFGVKRAVPADNPSALSPRFAETAFDSARGLGSGWRDLGWAPREVQAGKPAKLDLADRSGWIVARKGLSGTFGALFVRYQAPPEFGDFLELRLDSSSPGEFPRITVTADLRRSINGWTEVLVPLSALDPRGLPFEKVVLRARTDLPHKPVYVERIAFTERGTGDGSEVRVASTSSPPREGRFTVQCKAPTHPISPMIYGVGGYLPDGTHFAMGIGAKRWGGNPNTRYNWQHGHAWNAGADYFFRNLDYTNDPTFTYDRELQEMLDHGVPEALTVPTIGWVAKDTTSYSYPVSVFGPQEQVTTENPDMGNGKTKEGGIIPPTMPPTRTSVAAPPEFIGKWLATIRDKDQKRGRSVKMVILDNEPALWHSTHRDVHPTPITYNELLERTIAYGTAVRKAYPEVLIAGPAEWGWTGYFYSGLDAAVGVGKAPDRHAHRNVPLIPWWLHSVREYEKKNRIKLLDVLDVHFYPQ